MIDKMTDKSEILGELSKIINDYRYKYGIGSYDIVDIALGREVKSPRFIPVSVFRNRKVGVLEAVVKYLREECKLKFVKIAESLNRRLSTVVMSYRKAEEKSRSRSQGIGSELSIPVEIFRNGRLSMLENLVFYLRKNHDMRCCDIARMVGRDERTIWTITGRIKNKGISSKHL